MLLSYDPPAGMRHLGAHTAALVDIIAGPEAEPETALWYEELGTGQPGVVVALPYVCSVFVRAKAAAMDPEDLSHALWCKYWYSDAVRARPLVCGGDVKMKKDKDGKEKWPWSDPPDNWPACHIVDGANKVHEARFATLHAAQFCMSWIMWRGARLGLGPDKAPVELVFQVAGRWEAWPGKVPLDYYWRATFVVRWEPGISLQCNVETPAWAGKRHPAGLEDRMQAIRGRSAAAFTEPMSKVIYKRQVEELLARIRGLCLVDAPEPLDVIHTSARVPLVRLHRVVRAVADRIVLEKRPAPEPPPDVPVVKRRRLTDGPMLEGAPWPTWTLGTRAPVPVVSHWATAEGGATVQAEMERRLAQWRDRPAALFLQTSAWDDGLLRFDIVTAPPLTGLLFGSDGSMERATLTADAAGDYEPAAAKLLKMTSAPTTGRDGMPHVLLGTTAPPKARLALEWLGETDVPEGSGPLLLMGQGLSAGQLESIDVAPVLRQYMQQTLRADAAARRAKLVAAAVATKQVEQATAEAHVAALDDAAVSRLLQDGAIAEFVAGCAVG